MTAHILVLTPRFPYPVVGGDRLRVYQLCRALAGRYRLTLLSLCDSEAEMTMPLPDDGVFHRVERLYLPKWRSWLNCALALPGQTPLQIAYYRHGGFRRRALALMVEHDGTLAHLIRVGDVIKDAPGAKFLEMTDAISMNYSRIGRAYGGSTDLRSHVYRIEAKRLMAYEHAIVDNFDHSFLVSSIDRDFLFGDQPGRKERVTVSSNGVDLIGLPYSFSHAAGDLIFIGNMTSLQNLDAVLYMARDVLPLVRNKRPGVKLRVIGRIGTNERNQLEQISGIVVTGQVGSVAQAATGGAVGVCPIRLGAGIQNKVLEYMALGLPTVSTTIGLEGLSARDGIELAVADEPTAFAEQVLRLLDDRDSAAAIAQAARRFVECRHSWGTMLQPIVNIIQNRLAQFEVEGGEGESATAQ